MKVNLPNRHALSLVFGVAALSAPGCVDNSEAKGDFSILLCGSNTGTFGEALNYLKSVLILPQVVSVVGVGPQPTPNAPICPQPTVQRQGEPVRSL